MKNSILLALSLVFCAATVFGASALWSDAGHFDGSEITSDPIVLKPTDKLSYSSAMAEGEPASLSISVVNDGDPSSYNAVIYDNTSAAPVEGTVVWDYASDYPQFPTGPGNPYTLTETIKSRKK